VALAADGSFTFAAWASVPATDAIVSDFAIAILPAGTAIVNSEVVHGEAAVTLFHAPPMCAVRQPRVLMPRTYPHSLASPAAHCHSAALGGPLPPYTGVAVLENTYPPGTVVNPGTPSSTPAPPATPSGTPTGGASLLILTFPAAGALTGISGILRGTVAPQTFVVVLYGERRRGD